MYCSVIHTYTTTAQDTLYKITCKFYWHWWLWKIIYDYNREALGADNQNVIPLIPAGVTIKILELNTEPISHTIISGDTWHSLSKYYWGTESHWINIAIENDWKHLVEGEACVIPALVTKQDLKQAEELRRRVGA